MSDQVKGVGGSGKPTAAAPAEREELQRVLREELLRQKIALGLADDDEIDLGELVGTLWRRKLLLLVLPFLIAVGVAAYSLTLPEFFKAEATLFVHQKGAGGGGALSALLGNLPFGGMMGGGGGGSAEYLINLLKSKTFTDELLRRHNLASNPVVFGEGWAKMRRDDVYKTWGSIADLAQDKKTGLITIAVETKDATLSAELANSYTELLARFSKGPEKQKRIFVGEQLAKCAGELASAELALKAFQDEHLLVELDEQTKLAVTRLAELETEKVKGEMAIAMQESLLGSLGRLPQLVQVEAQKISEQAKQKVLNATIASLSAKLAQLPDLGLQFVRLKRELMVKQKLYQVLTEQHEMSKISEAEEGSAFEIIDRAAPPQRKSKPKRAQMVILSGVVGLMAAFFLVFVLEFRARRRREERKAAVAAGVAGGSAGA